MNTVDCDRVRPLMEPLSAGELTAAERGDMELHMNHCASCRAEAAWIRSLSSALHRELGSRRVRSRWPLAAVAAAFFVGILAFLMQWPELPSPATPGTPAPVGARADSPVPPVQDENDELPRLLQTFLESAGDTRYEDMNAVYKRILDFDPAAALAAAAKALGKWQQRTGPQRQDLEDNQRKLLEKWKALGRDGTPEKDRDPALLKEIQEVNKKLQVFRAQEPMIEALVAELKIRDSLHRGIPLLDSPVGRIRSFEHFAGRGDWPTAAKCFTTGGAAQAQGFRVALKEITSGWDRLQTWNGEEVFNQQNDVQVLIFGYYNGFAMDDDEKGVTFPGARGIATFEISADGQYRLLKVVKGDHVTLKE